MSETGPTNPAAGTARVGQALRLLAADAPIRLTVRGTCMHPLLIEKQEINVAAAARYWPGDVVAFDSPGGPLVVHRVIGYRWRRGRILLQTRADTSGTLDRPLEPRRVIGRVAEVQVPVGQRLRSLVRFARLWSAGRLPR